MSWACLPLDLVLLVDELLEAQGAEGHTAAIRATCRLWRHALQTAPARLQPLGKPAQMAAFPRAAAVDYGARGAGAALTDADLADACSLLGGRLTRLDIGGAFQLSTAGVQAALRACAALRQLAADGSTLQDDAFSGLAQAPGAGEQSSSSAAALVAAPCGSPRSCAPLQKLESLSLRGCLFLRGTLLADLAAACPHLTSLDLASCGLALNLNHDTAALLPRISSLQRLNLDGNQVDDASLAHVAALPRLRELSLRSSPLLTDFALRDLARRRGSTALARSSSDAAAARGGEAAEPSSSSSSGSGSGSQDVGLVALDISGCSGLTDMCWVAITQMQGLTSLRMDRMAHLLQFPSMPEQLPALIWRLPRLRRLSLAGSACHPSKLKLLAASCGGTVTHLDISTGGSGTCCAACTCCGPARQPQEAPGPPYKRLTSLHERDLCEAAQAFRKLQALSAAGAALPLRVCTAFLAAAPAGRLQHADLSGCCLDADHPAVEAAYTRQPAWQRQLFFSSGARRALNFDEMPAVTGNSVSHLAQLHAEADSWQRPATAGRFAAALRRQGASLRSLRLGGASGLKDSHLSCLRALSALTHLCLAGTGGAVSPSLLADSAAGCRHLQRLDIGGTPGDDACLAAAAALPSLRHLAAAGCPMGAHGVAALVAGPAAASLRSLDLSATLADDAAVAALAGGCPLLTTLRLTGCHGLTPAAVSKLCQLPRLCSLSLSRCPHAVTDAGLLQLAHALPQLTQLSLAESAHLTAEGIAAAAARMPALADLDLTACQGARDDQLLDLLSAASGGSGGSSGSGGSPGVGTLTPATIQLPQGGTSPTGSPFRRRSGGA